MEKPEEDQKVNKISSNPSRDATDSIRGYVYQAYQSLLAWIELDDNELLVLEGAEDFDIYDSQEVTTVQVKAGEKNLTLNSSSVIEAIDNYWLCQQSNKDFKVQFRFLSPANAGVESGDMLARKKGLDLWKECELPSVSVDELRAFLLQSKINDNIKKHIREWDDQSLKDKLITKIKWDLGSRAIDSLINLIEHRLITFGQERSCSPRSAKASLSHLLTYIINLLSTKGVKELKRSDFLIEFEEATSITVPNSALLSLTTSNENDRTLTIRNNAITLLKPPLSLANYIVKRDKLVENYLSTLHSARSLFLVGSTGMGKSYLALLISQRFNASWNWMPFRHLPAEKYHEYLIAIENLVLNDDIPPYLVLDDLDNYSDVRVPEALAILCSTIHGKNGLVIVTSNEPPTEHLEILGSKLEEIVKKVPGLDESEISNVLNLLGVVNESDLCKLSKVIWLATFGHPQLVHAKAKRFQISGWKTTISEVLDTSDLVSVRATARKRLLSELPSDNAKSMIYRISILNGVFTRSTALAVAGSPPPIIDAGEIFDQLVGPWIEEVANNQFRLSPLIHNVASDNYSEAQIQELHAKVLNGLLSTKNLDQLSYCQAIFHAYMSKDEMNLLILFNQLIMEHEIRDSRYIMDNLNWLKYIELTFIETPELELTLRIVQYYLTCQTENLEDIEKSISNVEASALLAAETSPGKLMEGIAYSCILINFTSQISSVTAIRLIKKLLVIEKVKINGMSLFEINRDSLLPEKLPVVGEGSICQIAFAAHITRIMGTKDYMELISALDELSKADREYLLTVSESDQDFIKILIGRSWWKDKQNETLDVDRASSIFLHSDQIAQKWGFDPISIESQVAISVLHSEYGNNSELALKLVDDALIRFPKSTELINQRFKVLFSLNRTEEALAEADRVLKNTTFNKIDRLFCIRSSAVAAAKLGDWRRAQNYFDKGISNIRSEHEGSSTNYCIAVGMVADAAFASWKQGQTLASIQKLIEALSYLPISKDVDELHRYHLEATFRHTVLWIHNDALNILDENTIEPIPGMCSNPSPNKEIINLPYVHISAVWEMLKSLDDKLKLNLNIKEHIQKLGFTEKPLLVHRYAAGIEISNIFYNHEFEKLIPAVVKVVEAQINMANCQDEDEWELLASIPRLPSTYWHSDAGLSRLKFDIISAVVVCVSENIKIPVDHWSSDLKSLQAWSTPLDSLFETISGKAPLSDSAIEEKLLYTVLHLEHQFFDLDDLWTFNFRLFEFFFKGDRSFVGKPIRKLTGYIWGNVIIHRQSELKLPKVGIPKIEAALRYKGVDDFNEVGKILASVAQHITLNIKSDVIEQLSDINLKS